MWKSKYTTKYPTVIQGSDITTAYCTLCRCEFGVGFSGVYDIKRHVNSTKHKNFLERGKKQKAIDELFKKQAEEEEDLEKKLKKN